MCGIAGHVAFSGPPDRDLVLRMSDRLAHRGPDDSGAFADDRVALSHRRLSIIDLSPDGAQPMCDGERSLWIVYNGEIYNYRELRDELAGMGCPFRTKTDTEVILQAYRQWGTGCLSHFNGMWAFAIWDAAHSRLFCARDRLGVKPFYWASPYGSFLFASEIKALLEHPGIGRRPNDSALLTYLAYGISDNTDATMFDGVFQLPPAHYLVVDREGIGRPVRYWDVEVNPRRKDTGCDDESAAGKFQDHLARSVRLRLRSDVPVGSCLSGGIDSSSIVMVLNRIVAQEHPESVGDHQKTFSVVFHGTPYDESRFIDQIVSESGVDAASVTPRPDHLWKELHDLLYYQDEPFASISIYAQYVLMRLVSRKVKVVLDGQGADELLGGYLAYQAPYISGLLKKGDLLSGLHELAGSLCRHHAFFRGAAGQRKVRASRKGLFKDIPASPGRYDGPLEKVLKDELTVTNLPLLLHWEDRNSMAFSIEARVPFLDYQLVEYAASLPLDQKIRSGLTKFVLRKAVRGIVPDGIRCRGDKMGFVTPEEVWMRGVLKPHIDSVLASGSFASRPYWDSARVKEEYQKYWEERAPYSPELWRIVCTELWLRTFFDSREKRIPDPPVPSLA